MKDIHIQATKLAEEAQAIADLFITVINDDLGYIAQDISDLISNYNKLKTEVVKGML